MIHDSKGWPLMIGSAVRLDRPPLQALHGRVVSIEEDAKGAVLQIRCPKGALHFARAATLTVVNPKGARWDKRVQDTALWSIKPSSRR